MEFFARQVSVSAAGDFFQLLLSPAESKEDDFYDPMGPGAPYLLISRQFEFPDGGRCNLETEDKEQSGAFKLELIDLRPTHLTFGIERKENNHIHVFFALDPAAFHEFRRIAEIIFGVREPD